MARSLSSSTLIPLYYLAVIFCSAIYSPTAQALTQPVQPLTSCDPNANEIPVTVDFEVIATGLQVPWSIAATADGNVYISERQGAIRLYSQDKGLHEQPWAEIPVVAKGVVGLMGIAVSPDYGNNGYVYAVGSYQAISDSWFDKAYHRVKSALLSQTSPDTDLKYKNRVYRLKNKDGLGLRPQVIIDDIPSDIWYGSSSLAFGPEGDLYISTGDAHRPELAQNNASLAGKILRYREDGSVPTGNPVPKSSVYALGLRNSQGLAWNTAGSMFATEHGPTGFDELNQIIKGGNYGWPEYKGPNGIEGYIDPRVTWFDGIAPSGLAVFNRPGHPWHGDLLVASLKSKQLRRITFAADDKASQVSCEQLLLSDQIGRIRAVHMGADGHVYITTSNRDHRGTPVADDDKLLRLTIQ